MDSPPIAPVGSAKEYERAIALKDDEKFLESARILRKIDPDNLSAEDKAVIKLAGECEALITFLKSDPKVHITNEEEDECDDEGNFKEKENFETEEKSWIKKGDNLRDTIVYYNFDVSTNILDLRVDSSVERSLLLPILAVLNESDLYKTWLPSWSFPVRFGATETNKLTEKGKVSQLLHVRVDIPWPLKPRDAMIGAFGFEDIDANGDLVIKVNSCKTGDVFLGMTVPAPDDPSIRRSKFSGGFLFRKDPNPFPEGFEKEEGDEDERVLVRFTFEIDPQFSYIPQWFLDFVIGTVVRLVSNQFFNVAREVRDGKREQHTNIMKERSEIYDWMLARVNKIFEFNSVS